MPKSAITNQFRRNITGVMQLWFLFFKVPALGAPNSGKGGNPEGVAKNILEYVFAHIVEFKKVNQEVAIGGGGAGQQGEFDTNMERDFEG